MTTEPSPADISSASPDRLTLMLFEGAVRFGRQAQTAIDSGDVPTGAHLVGRVHAIVDELDRSLNPSAGPISGHLGSIYDYLRRRLANAIDEQDALEEVVTDLDELRETWAILVENRAAEAAAV
jgi:flagellar protein FliS